MTELTPSDDNQLQLETISIQPQNRCLNLKGFVVIAGLSNLLIFSVNFYLGSQLTSIEKQFNLRSSNSGILQSGNDIGFLVASLFVTYVLKDTHRPKLLGFSNLLTGLASIMCSLPYFVTPKPSAEPTYNTSLVNLEESLSYCENSLNKSETCLQSDIDKTTSSRDIAFGLILTATFLMGVFKSPRSSLIAAYIDDNTKSVYTNGYNSIVIAIGVVGPVLAFNLGGLVSRFYVTLEPTNLTPLNPEWIGAWWLGFIVFGVLSILFSFTLCIFPDNQKGTKKKQVRKLSVKGSTIIVASSIGFLIGGIITSAFKLGPKGCLKLSVGALFVAFTLHWFCIIDFCQDLEVTSHTLLKRSLSLNITNNFNNTSLDPNMYCLECECPEDHYEPVCGEDGQIFRSPCYAGCRMKNIKTLAFSDCTCVGGNMTAKSGLCPVRCEKDFLVPLILSMIGIVTCINLSSNIIIIVRCVKESDKTMALSFAGFICSVIGWFPAPPTFGYIVDSSCKTWTKLPCGGNGACKEYDMDTFRNRYFVLQGLLCGLAFLLKLLATAIGLKSKRYFTEEKSQSDSTDLIT